MGVWRFLFGCFITALTFLEDSPFLAVLAILFNIDLISFSNNFNTILRFIFVTTLHLRELWFCIFSHYMGFFFFQMYRFKKNFGLMLGLGHLSAKLAIFKITNRSYSCILFLRISWRSISPRDKTYGNGKNALYAKECCTL